MRDSKGVKSHKEEKMPKVELTLSDDEKRALQKAADRRALKLATWCKAHLLLAANNGVHGLSMMARVFHPGLWVNLFTP
jgi:hypothetical protein